ncbi:MAG: hotdog fold thioesterase [Deltaproteobacteria bacterium]|nr:hotdog fold thioesterase [Deltaproteobacteria bacterium]MBN2845663.1 hotdog fold thioesterase [Deltaproteobacteria bacterium]
MPETVDKEALRRYFEKDRFATYVGIELLEISAGRATAILKIKEHHLNAVDMVHGGVLFALADLAFAAASNSHGTIAVAVNNSISFIKAAEGDVLYAEAREISKDRKLAAYSVEIKDKTEKTVVLLHGLAYRKKEKIDA